MAASLPYSMPNFLTVREAAERTGKSPSSIRRVIYPILQDDKHPDRKHIQPSVEDALALRVKGENFAWRLGEDFLRRAVPIEAVADKRETASRQGSGDADLLFMLRRELDIKNQQITQQLEVITKQAGLLDGLSERLREGNILIGTLQQRLALPEAKVIQTTEPPKPKNTTPAKPEKGTPPPAKPAKSKKGLFSRLFR